MGQRLREGLQAVGYVVAEVVPHRGTLAVTHHLKDPSEACRSQWTCCPCKAQQTCCQYREPLEAALQEHSSVQCSCTGLVQEAALHLALLSVMFKSGSQAELC